MKKQWWHDKVAYQIWPKSFYDGNGDGVGDIPGMIEKLDYLHALGVEILWISPVYRSPFVDQGYDISDYYDIDPSFGTMADMERLLTETKKRGMYVLMDLVVNHCSDQHAWFRQALADPGGEYGRYFYFRKGCGDAPPNNWRSYFGGSAWTRLPDSELWYLHFFAKEQPDLNWTNPTVRRKIYDMVNWWLDKGLAGFRLDAIINVAKDLTFADKPADRADGMVSPFRALGGAAAALRYLDELNEKTFRPHGALTVAELFDYDKAQLARFAGDGGCFSTLFDFSTTLLGLDARGWYAAEPVTAKMYRDAIFESQREAGDTAFLSNIIENHDEPRGVSRYLSETTEDGKKMLALLTMLRRGLPFLYQGQEIGMENKRFTDLREVNDVDTLAQYREARAAGLSDAQALEVIGRFSRDNGRTPFQWSDAANAGFTTGTPWTPPNPNYGRICLSAQQDDPDSLYSFYRRLIALRKDARYRETIVWGAFVPAYAEDDEVFAFYRVGEGQCLLVIANDSNAARCVRLHDCVRAAVVNTQPALSLQNGALTMAPWQALVLEVEA